MEHKYAELTEAVMGMCHSDKDNIVVLRQICWNLGYIADELAESNRLNARTIGEIVEDLEMHGIKPEPEKEAPAPGLKADVKLDSLGLGDNCFICGGALDYENIGGVIIDGYGATYCACGKCRNKFSNMLGTILLPNEMYF